MPSACSILTQAQNLLPTVDFVIVTSRQHSIEQQTRAWVERHYPGIFCQIVFGNHWGVSGAKRSKADLCREVGARILIDDAVDYALQCSGSLEAVLLFGDYAWNRASPPLPQNVERVSDWAQAAAAIAARLATEQS